MVEGLDRQTAAEAEVVPPSQPHNQSAGIGSSQADDLTKAVADFTAPENVEWRKRNGADGHRKPAAEAESVDSIRERNFDEAAKLLAG